VAIRAAATLDDDATPFIYGVQSGLFKRYGINGDLERAGNGASIAAGVLGGTFQVGKSSITTLCVAHSRDVPLVWLAPAGEYDVSNPGRVALVVRADSPIKANAGADLNGKTIGVSGLSDGFALAVKSWTDKHGGDAATLKLTEIPMAQSANAIDTGRLDASVVIEPFLDVALSGGKMRSIGDPVSGIANHFMQSAWFTSSDYAATNPDAVLKFIRAMRESATFCNANPSVTAPMLLKFLNLNTPLTSRIPLGVRFNLEQIQATIDLQVRYKMLPATFNARDVIYPAALRA
jgi:NitT/TauT family transport system substrate-binding protein